MTWLVLVWLLARRQTWTVYRQHTTLDGYSAWDCKKAIFFLLSFHHNVSTWCRYVWLYQCKVTSGTLLQSMADSFWYTFYILIHLLSVLDIHVMASALWCPLRNIFNGAEENERRSCQLNVIWINSLKKVKRSGGTLLVLMSDTRTFHLGAGMDAQWKWVCMTLM
jgi:hypothetical protein